MRPAMRLGDTKISQQEGGCLCFHRSAAIGVQRQLAGQDGMPGESIVKQVLEQDGVFRIGDAPADDAAAEDVEDDIEVEIPGSSSPRLKRPEAQQRQPMRMALAGHHLAGAFALALSTSTAHEAPM